MRSVAAIPIVIELCKGPRYSHELIDSLRGVAAAQTIHEALHRLIAGNYINCTTERSHGIRKRYALSERGTAFAQTRVEDLSVAR